MNKSELINELATALAKAQSQMRGAIKDSANPYFKSKYADLASVWEACREPLTTNGLAVVQTTTGESAETVTVETILTHASGQWISSVITMRPVKSDPQGIGSCLTYARRYGLSAMVGIAPEDDDGNAATHSKTKGKFSPEELEKRVGGIVEPIKPLETKNEPDEAVQEDFTDAPDRWQDVVVHLGTPKGKKLGELSDEVLQTMYDKFQPKPPYKTADVYLKNGLKTWYAEKVGKL